MTRPAINYAITGDVEQIRDLLFGPQQHDEHCRGYRWHQYMANQRKGYVAMMAAGREMIDRARMRNLVAEYMEERT